MINTVEKNWMMHRYDFLAVTKISIENVQKKMKKFYTQINLKEKNSDSLSFENIEENNFQVVISSNKKEKNYENKNDNFIVNNK